MNHAFFYTMWMAWCVCAHWIPWEHMAPVCTVKKRLASGGSVMLWPMFWNLAFCYLCGFYFDTYHLPKHCGEQINPFMETVFHIMAVISFSRIMHSAMKQKWFEDHNYEFEVLAWPQSLISQSNWVSVECAGQTNPIHGEEKNFLHRFCTPARSIV